MERRPAAGGQRPPDRHRAGTAGLSEVPGPAESVQHRPEFQLFPAAGRDRPADPDAGRGAEQGPAGGGIRGLLLPQRHGDQHGQGPGGVGAAVQPGGAGGSVRGLFRAPRPGGEPERQRAVPVQPGRLRRAQELRRVRGKQGRRRLRRVRRRAGRRDCGLYAGAGGRYQGV